MHTTRSLIIFGLILFLAFFLRFYKLTSAPPHLYWDEASIAYNAYSINETGKDEWGETTPMVFKAFGEYKLPVYIYVTSLSQKIFGLNDFAIRFPSAVAGTVLVLVVYFLAKELIGNQKVGMLASLFVAISPWALQFNRAGFEANMAALFLAAGGYLFLREKYFFSLFLLVASVYTYQGAVITAPLFLALLVLISYRKLKTIGKKIILLLAFVVIIVMPFVSSYVLSEKGHSRAASESFLNMPGAPITNLVNNYVANFSLDYLFFHGDQDGRHSVKKIGELYLWQLPTILVGIYVLFARRSKKEAAMISGWILIGSLPPALTVVSPHALRGLFAVFGWQIISAVGMVYLLSRLSGAWRFITLLIVAYSLIVYLHLYYVHYPAAYAADWQDGRRQTIEFVKRVEKKYDRIYISKDFEPIYVWLYWPIEPKLVQTNGHNDKVFGKFIYFDAKIEPPPGPSGQKSLIIAPPWFKDKNATVIRQINMAGGDPVFNIYDF